MRRAICNILIVILAFVLQTSIFPFIPFLVATPNLLVIVVFAIAFVYGEIEGVCYGVLSGLLMDMFYSGPFGYFIIIYGLLGYFNGFLSRYYFDDYVFLPVIMCTFNEVIYNLMLFVMRFILRGSTDFFYYFRKIMMPELMLTVLCTLILYRPILALNRKLRKKDEDKRGNELAQ